MKTYLAPISPQTVFDPAPPRRKSYGHSLKLNPGSSLGGGFNGVQSWDACRCGEWHPEVDLDQDPCNVKPFHNVPGMLASLRMNYFLGMAEPTLLWQVPSC